MLEITPEGNGRTLSKGFNFSKGSSMPFGVTPEVEVTTSGVTFYNNCKTTNANCHATKEEAPAERHGTGRKAAESDAYELLHDLMQVIRVLLEKSLLIVVIACLVLPCAVMFSQRFFSLWQVAIEDVHGKRIATGTDRILLGDHGPYFEFLNLESELRGGTPSKSRYFRLFFSANEKTRVYYQLRKFDKHAPPHSSFSVVNNYRSGQYADYRPGSSV